MAGISISVVIDAPVSEVWDDVADLGSHVEWMADAVAIRFTSEQRSGIGTMFDCDTKVGPLRTTDKMVVTSWEPERSIGVRHEGFVTGEGKFTLDEVSPDRTRFAWTEELFFPWWMGGRIGALAAHPVLKAVWRRNLRRLAARF